MITTVPFKVEHFRKINIQPSQRNIAATATDEGLLELEGEPFSFTFLDGDEVLAVAGLLPYGDGRALAWSFLASDLGARMILVTRTAQDIISESGFRRIEMSVDCDSTQAHRWARLLGFSMEAERMKRYSPDGRDCALYALVR